MEEIKFAKGSVPVRVAARVYGCDPSWVRAGIIGGWLPIGKATRNGGGYHGHQADGLAVWAGFLLHLPEAPV